MITIEALYQVFKKHPSVTTDTRNIKPGDLFFALKGPNFNGNAFAEQALEAGASYAVIDEAAFATSERMLLTEDCLQTLQQLAAWHRLRFNKPLQTRQVPFIAITGSNGKTTTKELVHAVLNSTYNTYTTKGNLNNHIGVPLTLLKVAEDAEMVVIEMGANHQQEIASYCRYTMPTHGLITNCGKAHLEGFGGIEGVRKGKGELFDFLRSQGGTAFACDDFDYFHTMTQGLKEVYWYGTQNGTVTGQVVRSEPFLELALSIPNEKNIQLKTRLVGSYNLFNVLAAVSIGLQFQVSFPKIKAAIEGYNPDNSRSQLIEKDGNHIIMDAYNANPSSMKLAVENFANLHADNKILFLGGMMELGEDSIKEHEALLALVVRFPWKQVILVGGDFKNISRGQYIQKKVPIIYFEDAESAASWWALQQATGNYLLVKGSRSMKMEKIIG